jgi:hypothetical protein
VCTREQSDRWGVENDAPDTLCSWTRSRTLAPSGFPSAVVITVGTQRG